MAFITIAGEQQIAKKQGGNSILNISKFILANIPNQSSEPATRIEQIPTAAYVVDQLDVTKFGYVNTNQVVYSLVMGSNIGDYDFNWIGLVDDEGVLIAVSYVPTIQKRKNAGAVAGNTLTRNFLLAYTGIQQTTAINIAAETWQLDFNARLTGIDERGRLENVDIYGQASFIDDGWQLTRQGSTNVYHIGLGVAYVGGIRVVNSAIQEITTDVKPNQIWANVSLQGDISDKTSVVEYIIDIGVFEDYTDANGVAHYLVKIADLDTNGDVVDLRTVYSGSDEFISRIAKIYGDENSAYWLHNSHDNVTRKEDGFASKAQHDKALGKIVMQLAENGLAGSDITWEDILILSKLGAALTGDLSLTGAVEFISGVAKLDSDINSAYWLNNTLDGLKRKHDGFASKVQQDKALGKIVMQLAESGLAGADIDWINILSLTKAGAAVIGDLSVTNGVNAQGVSSFITPSQDADDTQPATTAFVKTKTDTEIAAMLEQVPGVSQTQKDVVSSRFFGASNINLGKKGITVSVTVQAPQGNNILLFATVDGVGAGKSGGYSPYGDLYESVSFFVGVGQEYVVNANGAASLHEWSVSE